MLFICCVHGRAGVEPLRGTDQMRKGRDNGRGDPQMTSALIGGGGSPKLDNSTDKLEYGSEWGGV